MNTKHVAILAMVSAVLLPGLTGAGEPQDYDNLDACCLAAEYRLPESQPRIAAAAVRSSDPAHSASQTRCQVPLGDAACCVGAEWKLAAE